MHSSKADRHLTSRQRRNLLIIRVVLCVTTSAAIAYPHLFQPAFDGIWVWLKARDLYNASIWETLLTISSYASIEAFYTSLVIDPSWGNKRIDLRPGRAHLYRNGTVLIRPYGRRLRELLEYALPLLFLDMTMVKKFAGVPLEDIINSGGYDLAVGADARDWATGMRIQPTWQVPTLHRFSLSNPVQLTRALPHSAPTSREVVLRVVGALVLYDFLFYLPHITMHKPRYTPRLQISTCYFPLSITERMTLLLAANLSLHLMRAHPLTRTIFVPIFLYLLVENHSGLDLPYGYHRILPSGWAAGPAEHAEHHRHGKANFQPYLTWEDKLTGTHSVGDTEQKE
ncbi:hypothetical protein JCM24511_02118 [Saitozyma sp. JCM 24511]|nr:hypothetical protein JCM24511_02118 [Saitozyma sp. JCM 24511]